YKAIGITDNLLFVTNKSNDGKAEATIGVPPVAIPTAPPNVPNPLALQLGKLQVRPVGALNLPAGAPPLDLPGAPIRVNGNLKLVGTLNLQADPRLGEAILASGDIIVDDPANPPTFLDPSTGVGAPL